MSETDVNKILSGSKFLYSIFQDTRTYRLCARMLTATSANALHCLGLRALRHRMYKIKMYLFIMRIFVTKRYKQIIFFFGPRQVAGVVVGVAVVVVVAKH